MTLFKDFATTLEHRFKEDYPFYPLIPLIQDRKEKWVKCKEKLVSHVGKFQTGKLHHTLSLKTRNVFFTESHRAARLYSGDGVYNSPG